MTFEFYTEDGVFKLEYADYLKRPDLMAKLHDNRRVFVNLGLRLFSFDRKWLKEHPNQAAFVETVRVEQQNNPLRYFLPHCANSHNFDTPSHRFINDAEHIYTGLLAGNRYGKTTAAIVKVLLTYGVIPADPSWECFQDHGIRYREFTGPKEIAVASYNWNNIEETIWPQVVRAWVPKAELGPYANYQAPRRTAFSVPLDCGSIIHFKCMAQPQSAFESQALDGFFWDEQGMEAKVNGAEARLKTLRSFSTGEDGYDYLTSGWHVCSATPHKVEGRSDTGGGTWFEKLYDKTLTKGWTVKFYEGNIVDEEPDWVFPEAEKIRSLAALDEAKRANNKKEVRSLESRIFGRFETTGGRVYDEFDQQVHVIDSIKIEPEWCAFRCMDHGRTNPTSCLWVAVTPLNEYIVYREYLSADATIGDNCANIVRMSGNVLEPIGDIDTGMGVMSRYVEKAENEDSEHYIFDVIDGRSFRNPDTNSRYCLGDIYKFSGLKNIRPAPIQSIEHTIPLVKEVLRIDSKREHLATKQMGAPRLYVTRNCPNLISHIKGYRNKELKDGVSEKPNAKDDHDLDALRYGIMLNPRHIKTKPLKPRVVIQSEKGRKFWVNEDDTPRSRRVGRDPFTGY